MAEHPRLLQTVLDTTDVRVLAEFYRGLLGLRYRPGDEPPEQGGDDADWLVLRDHEGVNRLAFQQVDRLERATWPDPEVPQQLHLDTTVPSLEELHRQRERAESLGAHLCWTVRRTPRSRCSSSPTPPATPSASSSPDPPPSAAR